MTKKTLHFRRTVLKPQLKWASDCRKKIKNSMKKTFSKFLASLVSIYRAWQNRRRYSKCVREAARILRQTKAQWPGCEGAMMVNSWPPTSGSTTGFTASKTTVMWGTDGLLQSPKPSGGFYVVTRFNQKQLVDVTRLPNGSGSTSNRVVLIDGAQWEITVRDDSTMTPPVALTTITITDAAGHLGAVGNVYTAKVLDNSYESAPKQAGERVILAENLVLVDSQTPGSAQ